VMPDATSGNSNRFTVLLHTCENPLVVGRELPMSEILQLITEYESELSGFDGNIVCACKAAAKVQTKRKRKPCVEKIM